jgi:hypothetical protein
VRRENNSLDFGGIRGVRQNLEDVKSPSGLYDVREVHQNFEDEKNSSEFYEFRNSRMRRVHQDSMSSERFIRTSMT